MHTSLSAPGWRSHLRAALAMARRNWLQFKRYPLEAISEVLHPLIWLTPVYFLGRGFTASGGAQGFAAYSGTQDYMSFILVGAVLSSYLASVFWGMGFSLKREMDAGVLESNWMMPIPRWLFLVGESIAQLLITTLNNALMLLLAWAFFGFEVSGSLLGAALVLLPLLAALYGLGFALAGMVLLIKEANTLIDISNFAVSQLSGSQFPVHVLPRLLLPISLVLPLTYGYDALRGILLDAHTLLPLPYELAILLIFMAVMLWFGYGVFSRVERRVRRLGTLGTH